MVSNKYGIEIFYNAFLEAAEGAEVLDQRKFHYAIILLAKALFSNRPGSDERSNPFEEMFTTMLIDKTISAKNQLVGGRIPILDDDTKEVLSEEAVKAYIAYQGQLKSLFQNFIDFNLMDEGPRILWREIADRNFGIKFGAFLKFLRDNHLIPILCNVETLHTILKSTIPPITQSEFQYYEEFKLLKTYEDSVQNNYRYIPSASEPEMLFHEFVFVIGRMAHQTITITDSIDSSITEKMQILLVEKLRFKQVDVEDFIRKTYHKEEEGEGDSEYSEESEEDEEYVGIDDP